MSSLIPDVAAFERRLAGLADAPAILARRLDAANRSLIEVKRQLQAGEPRSVIGRTVEKVEELLRHSGAPSLVYAGYPSDPFAPDNSVH